MRPKYKIGKTVYYMYLNMICKTKIKTIEEIDGEFYYSDEVNQKILEKYIFVTKEELFDFHSGKIKNKK